MSELHGMLAEMADRLLARECTRDVQSAAERGEWPDALWQGVAGAGMTLAAVPEALGGAGAALGDASALMRAAGRFCAPVPLVEAMLGNWLLARAGAAPSADPLTLAASCDAQIPSLSRAPSGWIVRGSMAQVPWAGAASRIVLVAALEPGRQAVVQIPAGACTVQAALNVAGEPRDAVSFEQPLQASDIHELPAGHDHADLVRQLGALARCQQMAGAMEWILERCCAYAGERVQFGKPIGSFQALQHMVAVMATQVSAACMAADAGIEAFEGGDVESAAGYAKARVGEAAGETAALAHQLHGAMGYSHEYPLHFRTRRLWAWRDDFGSERFWNLRAGRRLAGRSGHRLWSDLAA